jgi:hypothetical protein
VGSLRNDVLAEAVAQVLLFGIAAAVLEKEDGDGGFVRER